MMRANNSGRAWCCAIAAAWAAPRSSSRSRQARPVAEFSTPRNKRCSGIPRFPAPLSGAANRKGYLIRLAVKNVGWGKSNLPEFADLPVLGSDPPDGTAGRAHHNCFGFDRLPDELHAAQHAAIGDAGRGEQAFAPDHIF